MFQDNDSGLSPEEIKRFLEAAQELHTPPDEDGNIISPLTKAGRALQKHGVRPETAFPKPQGNDDAISKTAKDIVNDILSNPNSKIIERSSTGRYGDVVDIVAPDGRALRYDKNGNWIGFREP